MLLYSVSMRRPHFLLFFFFFNDTATTEIYTLSLHDALPISQVAPALLTRMSMSPQRVSTSSTRAGMVAPMPRRKRARSEEHTSELQSPDHLVCRLLLEKKKTKRYNQRHYYKP